MKTKIKRHSRSVLSVVLALCMLLSCMTAGMIMTDAARVNDEEVTDVTDTTYNVTASAGAGGTLTASHSKATAGTTITATATPNHDYTSTTVYYDNYLTKWAKVFAYSWIGTADSVTYTESGAKPGIEMTQVGTSSIYEIRIPYSAGETYIIFTGSGGASNAGATIEGATGNAVPGENKQYKSTTADASRGTWSDYTERNNVYTVTPGQSVKGNNKLYYDGITATMYDYYVDGEYNNGWLKGIGDRQYSKSKGKDFDWNPYGNLNTALSQYATDEGVDYPLYFGYLDTKNGRANNWGSGGNPSSYKNWNLKANNANGLSDAGKYNAAVQGLASSSELNSNIAYSSGDEMVLFNEDWLSQENSIGKPLATILHSTGFPVRKIFKTTKQYVYLDISNKPYWYNNNNCVPAIKCSNGTTTTTVVMTNISGNIYEAEVDANAYTTFAFVRHNSSGDHNGINFSLPTDNEVLAILNKNANGITSWKTYSEAKESTGYTYYEYDSTGGKDNAFIQNINSTAKTATIEYSDSESVKDLNGHAGFFPFDYTTGDIAKDNRNLAHDMGFGMKLEIPFTINQYGTVDGKADGTAQTFNFSGDDDLWVYIDGQLVLDLGGAHPRTTGSINFKTLLATADKAETIDGSAEQKTASFSSVVNNQTEADADTLHKMTIYYMERGMGESNLKFNFSFHAISNLLTTEKKVRTNNINSGFYETNDNISDDTIKNKSDVQNKKGYITKFEKSYQNEVFAFDHKVSSSSDGAYAYPAQNFTYSKNVVDPSDSGETSTAVSQTYTAGDGLTYTLTNDDKAIFKDKFTAGHYIQLNETMASTNKYSYDPTLTVYDDTDSTGETKQDVDGNNPYTFPFQKVNSTGSEFDVVNIRARYENEMKQHTLTVTKKIGDALYNNEDFTFQLLFNSKYEKDGADEFVAYPLYCVSDASSMTKIGKDGKFTVKANETVTFTGIPEGIEFKIIETDCPNTFAYGSITASGATATPVSGQNAATMTMGEEDVDVTVNNNDNHVKATIRVKYAPSYYDFEQGTNNISQDTYTNTSGSYTNTAVVTQCQTSFTDGSNTSTTEISADKMVETDTRNASESFAVSVDKVNAGGKLFIGWYDEDGNRYNDDDATQHNLTASAAKDEDRIFEARFIDQPTYRIDYAVPTRLWGDRIYKVFGKVTNDMISNTAIGYDSNRTSTSTEDRKYYITGSMVEANKPSEEIFLKDITWASVDTETENGKTTTQYKVGKKVTHNSSGDAESVTKTGTVTYDLYRSTQATAADKQVTVDLYYDCSDLTTLTEQVTCDYGSSVNDNTVVAINIPENKTFYRWKIETLNSLGGTGSDNKLVTYDYSKNFNYVVYDNYKVTAELLVKKDGKDYNPYSAKNPDDPYNSYAPSNTTSVINLGQTRSHWNDTKTGDPYVPGENDSQTYTSANTDTDRLFIDLALSYSYDEVRLNTLENCMVGFKINYWDDNAKEWKYWKTEQFSSTELTDKNRIEYFYGFKNSANNRSKILQVQPIIDGQNSGDPIEFQFNDTKFTAQG